MGKKITDKKKEKVVRVIDRHKDKGITNAYKHAVLATGISEPMIIKIWKEHLKTQEDIAISKIPFNATHNPLTHNSNTHKTKQ